MNDSVKQKQDSWEVLILEEERERQVDGSPKWRVREPLALVADAKSPYSHPHTPAQAEDNWLWVGQLSALPLPASWSSGHLGSWGDGDRKVDTSMQLTKGHRGGGDSGRDPGGEPGPDTFQVQQEQLFLTPGKGAIAHQNPVLAYFHLLPTLGIILPRIPTHPGAPLMVPNWASHL